MDRIGDRGDIVGWRVNCIPFQKSLTMEYTNDKKLSFPQRNWLLLCILVAIISPLVVNWVRAGAHKEALQQSLQIQPVNSGGAPPASGGAGQDTSYKVATPPTGGSADSAGKK